MAEDAKELPDASPGLGTSEVEHRLLALNFEHLRARDAKAEAELTTSLGVTGQLHPVLVVVRDDGGYVLIDGYRRVRGLRKIGRDTVVILVLGTSEVDALAYCHRLATGRRRSALEEGWLVRELRDGIGRTLADIGVALGRSTSWVSRRFGMATALPAEIETAVRAGLVSPHGAMRSLLPLARANKGHAQQIVSAIGRERLTTRELGALWAAYRAGDAEQRARIAAQPWLLLRAKDSLAGAPTEVAVTRAVNAATRALGRAHTSLMAARSHDPDVGTSPAVRRAIGRAREAALALSKEEM
jgi:ParB family transcriptional regulator, chromosome partitioning protein